MRIFAILISALNLYQEYIKNYYNSIINTPMFKWIKSIKEYFTKGDTAKKYMKYAQGNANSNHNEMLPFPLE